MPDHFPVRVRVELTPPQAVPSTSGLLFEPERDEGLDVVALAPGAGTDLLHPVLLEVARGLAGAGHPTLLFNFAFTEAGRKRPDPADRLQRTYADAVAWLRSRFGEDRGLLLGGRSMGGRIASWLAAGTDDRPGVDCRGLILLGYPLHPQVRRGEPVADARLRTGHWPRLDVPALFVQGDRDAMCHLDVLERERTAHLDGVDTRVHVVEGGDHSFGVRIRDERSTADVLAEVRDAVVAWTLDHRAEAVTS